MKFWLMEVLFIGSRSDHVSNWLKHSLSCWTWIELSLADRDTYQAQMDFFLSCMSPSGFMLWHDDVNSFRWYCCRWLKDDNEILKMGDSYQSSHGLNNVNQGNALSMRRVRKPSILLFERAQCVPVLLYASASQYCLLSIFWAKHKQNRIPGNELNGMIIVLGLKAKLE